MKKFLSFVAAFLFAANMMADPITVVLPAVLDVTNVSFRSEGMPDFVIPEGQDYAGTYFDMGAHDSSNDTLLYAEWNVKIQPIKYNLAVDVYNTNSWRVQLYILNQAGDTVKDLRYKGSSGQKGQFSIGSLDLSDLAAGEYKVRARAATAWSAMKLKDVIFEADYQGVTVELPDTLRPAYALLSANASITNGAIAFKPSTAPDEYATWNVSFAEAGNFDVSIDITATNGHNYGIALLSADGTTEIDAINEGGQNNDTGVKRVNVIGVPAAGKYVVKLTNSIQWSEAVLNNIVFAPAPIVGEPKYYLIGSLNQWTVNDLYEFTANPGSDGEYMLSIDLAKGDSIKVVKVVGDTKTWYPDQAPNYVVDSLHAGKSKKIYFRPDGQGGEGWYYGVFFVEPNPEPTKYYLKNNWDGGMAWTWKEMKLSSEPGEEPYYMLEGVVFGGEGVNLNTAEDDKDARWIKAESITAFDAALEPATLGALDTVVFIYNPEQYSSYEPETKSGMNAIILGKYQKKEPVDPSKPYTLTFTYYNSTSGDGGTKLTKAEDIFAKESQDYIAKVDTGIQVYAGRKYVDAAGDSIFSNLKLGSSSNAAEFKFTLAYPTEVDSIVFNAAMYADNEGSEGFAIGKDTFKLSAGKLKFEECVWKPEGKVETIDLVQMKAAKGRFFLTSIAVYPKAAPAPKHTYTVAGAPAAVFGEEWNASYEENDMEFLANQAYTWIKDSVVLRAGTTVQFKVVEDHAWAKAWPEQNYQLAIPEDGYYSILIVFNLAADPDSIVEAKAVKVGEIEPTIEHIFFTQACAKDSLASDAKFGSEIFNVTITDTDNKMEIDANNVFFGSDSIESVYNFRLKTGGKSSAKNFMTINIPEDGLLAIAVRTSSNSDSTRTLVLVQGEDTLYNKVVKESDAVKYKINDSTTISLYPYVVVPVKAGQVTVTYPVGALNFYAFAFTNQIPEPTHTYTVAGAPATLFGKEWNASYAENDMESYGTDTYFWRRDSVALAAGNVEFKIVEDHSWSKGWPAQNYVLKIDSAGLYNITIMFKPKAADPDSMVSAIAYKVADAVVLPKIIMHGNFTGSWADTEEFAIAEDNLTASLKLNLTAGSYEFGMKFDGVWKANAAELTREAPETSLLEGNGNMKITADVDGEYIFTYTFLGEKLAVTYPAAAPVAPTTAPAAPTAAEDDVLAIYCNHYTTNNLNFGISGWAGPYQVLDLEGTNVGYWTAMTWECIIDPAHTDDAHDLSGYKKLHVDLWAPKAAKIKFTVEAVAGGNYKDGVKVDLAAGWNCFDFVVAEWTGNYDFKNVKCFVFEQYQTPAEESFEGNPFAFANIYLYDKEPQAIDNIDANTKATKTIVNGMLIIEKNGKTYNVLGTLVK